MQFGCAADELIIQVSDHPVAPSLGHEALTRGADRHRLAGGLELEVLVLPGRPDLVVTVRVRLDLLGGVGPVLADVRPLLLQQVDRGVELLVVQLVRVVDPEIGLVRLQVDGGVGDVDRVVVGRDLALVLGRLLRIQDHRPGLRRRADVVGVPHQQVRPATVRDPVMGAVERVVRLVLEVGEDRLVVRHQVDVYGRHIAGFDEATARVAGSRDAVVLAGAHQLDHLVRRAGHLVLDLAAGLLLERLRPRVLDVACPGDQVQLSLSLADRLCAGVLLLPESLRRRIRSRPWPRSSLRRTSMPPSPDGQLVVLSLGVLPSCV